MAELNDTPIFQLQKTYLKDLSVEQPNSPRILYEAQQAQSQAQTQLGVQIGYASEQIGESMFEICVAATITATVLDKTLFLIEAKQAGIFEIRNVPADQLPSVVCVAGPYRLFPYLQAVVADMSSRAGFPPVLLAEVNFQAMFEAQQEQQAQANESPVGATLN